MYYLFYDIKLEVVGMKLLRSSVLRSTLKTGTRSQKLSSSILERVCIDEGLRLQITADYYE